MRTVRQPRPDFRRWMPLYALPSACLLSIAVVSFGCSSSDSADAESSQKKWEVAEDSPGVESTDGGGTGDASDTAGATPSAPVGSTGGQRSSMQPSGGVPEQPPTITSDKLDPVIVPPDATPVQLVEALKKLDQQYRDLQMQGRPAPGSENTVLDKMRAIFDRRLEVADKLLASSPLDAVQKKTGIEAKLNALAALSQLSPERSRVDEVKAFAQTLAADKDPELAIRGRTILFGLHIGEVSQKGGAGTEGLMTDLQALLANEARNGEVQAVCQQLVLVLRQLGREQEARTAFRMTAEAFKNHKDPEVAAEAANMFQQLDILDLDLDAKLRAIALEEKDAEQAFTTAFSQMMARPNPGPIVLDRATQTAEMLEQMGKYALGIQVCDSIELAFAKSKDQELVANAQRRVQQARRRLELVGKPLVIEGTLMDGTAFDFARYKGKIVLVDFWATWCGPCLQEMPNVRKNYEAYRDKGFEVIGVNLDQNAATVRQFLESEKLPWVTISNNALADQCGVETIPFVVLLDRQGIVQELHVRGQALDQKLAELLGPPEPAGATPGTKQPAAGPGPSKQGSIRREHSPSGTQLKWAGLVAEIANDDSTTDRPATGAGLAHMVVTAARTADASDDDGPSQKLELPEVAEDSNPYLASASLTPAGLVDYLMDMEEKPQSIQRRPGFAEAIVEAATRVIAAETKSRYQVYAALVKFKTLHERACLDDEQSDRQLMEFVSQMASDPRSAIAEQVAFFRLERETIEAVELPVTEIPPFLARLDKYFSAQEKLIKQHLRLASSTVKLINRLEKDDERQDYFGQFGKLFAKSRDNQLARYGRKIAKSGGAETNDLVGTPLDLSDKKTALGVPLDWPSYRGQVVLVDFWATWCGPCLREYPHLRDLYDQLHGEGLEVVAISLDKDQEKLAAFLDEKKIPWTNVVGSDAQQVATDSGISGIPTMMVLNREGTIVAVGHRVTELEPEIRKLLKSRTASR